MGPRGLVMASLVAVLGCGVRSDVIGMDSDGGTTSGPGTGTTMTTSSSSSTGASTSSSSTSSTSTTTTGSTDDTTGTSGTTGTTGGPVCPELELPSQLPLQFDGSTLGAGNETGGACGGDGGEDVSLSYTAPEDGIYVFDTPGSVIDTVLYVRSECDGAMLGCGDDVGDASWSRVGVELSAGETVYLTVDSAGAAGDFTLQVRAAPSDVCPNHDLGSTVPQLFLGNTSNAADDFASQCGGLGSPDESMVFTAPGAGRYQLATFGSAFDTIVSVRDLLCSGAELLCNQDSILIGGASLVEGLFDAGQQVTAIVDGFVGASGDYALRIERGDLAPCPDATLGSMVPADIVVSTVGRQNARIGTCGGGSAPERVVQWTAPVGNAYRFFTEGSSYDPVVHVRSRACHGPELGCSDDGPSSVESSAVAFVPGGETVFVAVDGYATTSGTTTLRIQAVPAQCPHVDLGSDFPLTYAGSTVDQTNGFAGACGGDRAPERSHVWTAPFAGTYVIDTFPSPFDTVLYVRDGGCVGPELGCNDHESPVNIQSIVTLDLAAGQTIVIYVDGHYVQQGDYVLRIR